MNILICTGVSAGDVGGPVQYVNNLAREFTKSGHQVRINGYFLEKKLPIFFRHLLFFIKIIPNIFWAHRIIAMDTYSVGVPSVLASTLFNKPIIVRIGGDFLWEKHISITESQLTLKNFYKSLPPLSFKEKAVLFFTKWMLKHADYLAFNTNWQKEIWESYYKISSKKIHIINNHVPEKRFSTINNRFEFLWAGRPITLKNLSILKKVILRIQTKFPSVYLTIITESQHEKVLEGLKNCYAAVLPSLTDICPNFIIEAASFGKPFIMTKETGISEIFPNSGIYIDPMDENALEKSILDLLDEEKYNKESSNIKLNYIPRSFKIVAEEFLSIYVN